MNDLLASASGEAAASGSNNVPCTEPEEDESEEEEEDESRPQTLPSPVTLDNAHLARADPSIAAPTLASDASAVSS